MRRITLPGTTLAVSRLSFGTGSLHHLYSSRARQALLGRALDIGITHFDTAPSYGGGLAEQELGAFYRANGSAITLATKVGLYAPGAESAGTFSVWARKLVGQVVPSVSRAVVNWSVSAAEKSFERSLRRLGAERLDLLFLHEPDPKLLASDEFLAWLERQMQKGTLSHWGLAGQALPMTEWVTNHHPVAQVLQVKDSLNRHEADAILKHDRVLQMTYGYFHSEEVGSNSPANTDILGEALRRNRTGSVLFSTRRLGRIQMLGKRAKLETC